MEICPSAFIPLSYFQLDDRTGLAKGDRYRFGSDTMIKNDLQLKLSKSSLKKFQETLTNYDQTISDDDPLWVIEVHKTTIVGEIERLKNDIDEYERIKSGLEPPPSLDVITEIPYMLIKKRIALGWTHEDLARRLGVRAQQVQNDEATDYESASLSRLIRTAQVMQTARRKRNAK